MKRNNGGSRINEKGRSSARIVQIRASRKQAVRSGEASGTLGVGSGGVLVRNEYEADLVILRVWVPDQSQTPPDFS